MREFVARGSWLAVASALLLSGCDSVFGSDASITLTPSTTSASVGQGTSTTVTLTIDRSHFTKDVTITLEKPEGISASVSPATVPNGLSTAILTISAAGTATPGAYPITVHASGDGVDAQTATIDVTITVTGTFSLGVLEQSLSVAQGGAGTATVLLARFQGNGSNVTLVANGVPTGVSASIASTPTTQTSAALSFAATGGAAPGSYTVSVVASSPGFADQTVTFPLVVIAPPSTAAVSVPFCANDMPAWFAYRNEGYAWQRMTPTGSNFNFDATDRVSIAYVWPTGSQTNAQVVSLSRTELMAGTAGDCGGPKSLTGSASGLTTGQTAFVNLGAATVQLSPTNAAAFTLPGVPNGPRDLVAVRGAFVGSTTTFHPDAIVIRRSLDLANGSTIDPIDFAGVEAFAPITTTLTLAGLQGTDQAALQNTFWSTTSTYASLEADDATSASAALYSVPSAKQVAGDLHELFVDAYSQTASSLTGHSFATYYATPTNRNETLGPGLATPTLNTVAVSPYARMRGRLASQPEYNTSVQFGYYQQPATGAERFVTLSMSAAYLGGTPTTWEAIIPDLTAASGFDATWMLIPSEPTGFYAEAFSGRTDLLLGAHPADGDIVKFAYRVGTIFTSQIRSDALLSETGRWVRPVFRQYLRR